ncbi:MAG TPA: discoidin domain-containing protein [Nitrososphaeraceae archaeon]|nr:discoidin domain-containing protein [Nitrososphaeraceae archaeon]
MIIILDTERNTILSVILAGILLFSLIASIPSPMAKATMLPNNAFAQNSSTYINSSSNIIVDANRNTTIKNNTTQTVIDDNNTSKTQELESWSNNTLFFKNEIKNETGFVSNVTNGTGNVFNIINSIGQSSGATGDFNGDGMDDLAIGVPREDEEFASSCQNNVLISSVMASGNDGNVPQNVLDNNLGTRWSSFGIGQSITADLGSVKKVCDVAIAWFNGDSRQYSFDISTSPDGTTFTDVLNNVSSGTTTLSEFHFFFPPINARFIKVTVNGNTVNDWASITELDIREISCTSNMPISSVMASGNDGNVPQNVLDNNLGTRWSSFGIGQSITADLGSVKKVCSIDIAWFNGDSRQYSFDIGWSVDGTTFIGNLRINSSGTTLNSEIYNFGISELARFIKVTVNGNTVNDWASITELDIFTPPPIFDSGAVNVIYGSTVGLNGTKLSTGNGEFDQVWRQDSFGGIVEHDDQFGASLAVGDFNRDGFSDLAIGAPAEDFFNGEDTGVVNVMYGSSDGLHPTGISQGNGRHSQIWTQDFLDGIAEPGDLFGYTLKTGDFNRDGFSDLAIGAPAEDIGTTIRNTGAVNVIYGSSDGLRATAISQGNGRDNQLWTQDTPEIRDPDNFAETGDWFGSALSTGDFNRDGIIDLAVGVSDEDLGTIIGAGQVMVIYGSSNGLSGTGLSQGDGRVHQVWRQGSNGIKDNSESGDRFGHALATGDFNKDTFADLAIGAWEEKVGNNIFTGAVNVIYGSSDGLRATAISQGNGRDNQVWMQGVDGVNDDAEAGDRFGTTLVTGDFNIDGASDLAIGAPFEDLGLLDAAGAVNVIYGSSAGLSTIEISQGNGRADQIWMQNVTNVEGDPQGGDLFGIALATGDFNNDTISDLVIGVPGEDADFFDAPAAGGVNVIYGSLGLVFGSGGLSPTVPLGGFGRADQLLTQNRASFWGDPEPEDRFGSSLG